MSKETKELIEKLNNLHDWILQNSDKKCDPRKDKGDSSYYKNSEPPK